MGSSITGGKHKRRRRKCRASTLCSSSTGRRSPYPSPQKAPQCCPPHNPPLSTAMEIDIICQKCSKNSANFRNVSEWRGRGVVTSDPTDFLSRLGFLESGLIPKKRCRFLTNLRVSKQHNF